jgi:hypothetical protein
MTYEYMYFNSLKAFTFKSFDFEDAWGYFRNKVALWPWSHGSWIYNYLCNQRLSPLMLWVQISIRSRCTKLCDQVCLWLATGRWFSRDFPVSSTNETDHHDIAEILLKVALNTIKQAQFLKHILSTKVAIYILLVFFII